MPTVIHLLAPIVDEIAGEPFSKKQVWIQFGSLAVIFLFEWISGLDTLRFQRKQLSLLVCRHILEKRCTWAVVEPGKIFHTVDKFHYEIEPAAIRIVGGKLFGFCKTLVLACLAVRRILFQYSGAVDEFWIATLVCPDIRRKTPFGGILHNGAAELHGGYFVHLKFCRILRNTIIIKHILAKILGGIAEFGVHLFEIDERILWVALHRAKSKSIIRGVDFAVLFDRFFEYFMSRRCVAATIHHSKRLLQLLRRG